MTDDEVIALGDLAWEQYILARRAMAEGWELVNRSMWVE